MLLVHHWSILDYLRSSHSSKTATLSPSDVVQRFPSLARWLRKLFLWRMSIRLVYMLMYLTLSMIYSCIVYSIDNWHQPQVMRVVQLAVIPHLWLSSNARITKQKHWWIAFELPTENHWSTRKGLRSGIHSILAKLISSLSVLTRKHVVPLTVVWPITIPVGVLVLSNTYPWNHPKSIVSTPLRCFLLYTGFHVRSACFHREYSADQIHYSANNHCGYGLLQTPNRGIE